MAFHINQGSPNPLSLEPGANASFTIEVYVDGNPVEPGEIIQVKLPEGLVFPPTGEIRYMNLDSGINEQLSIESREPDGRLVRFKAKEISNQPVGFYSVNVQTAATTTPGDRTIPDGLTIGTTTAPLSFRISPPQPVDQRVYGIVHGDGTVYSGSGFTARKMETGAYEITFLKAFTSVPAVVATAFHVSGSLLENAVVRTIGVSKARIDTGNSAGQPADQWFTFMAAGLTKP
ncbi:hypothetical protein B7755_007120 [Streptomyces sp. NBS 14/10]|uniref:hypothetical protein n=1 Tax=Streptomyces sp. NBS 14/10 TaxID=1945643 RepID=UPI000B7E9F67|nr:hypothetical protein [Streptomyces sp. NBS 14/10]KAK1177942.1 hypothetical protein B7755_007120 [Streptomyces sp. NBS 14/10]